MARINIPKPISSYRDLGTVELAKLARNQYIEGYSAADEFSNSVGQMQSLEKDAHLKNQLSQKYTGMLENWANRGDYETLGIAINKGARAFTNEYSPIAQSVKNRQDYMERLQKAYDKGDINANTYQGRLAQSDYLYQGIQYDENGVLQDNSIYNGRNFFHDVDITEKVVERMKAVKPFIRQNLGTDIPYNEDFEITTTRGDKGEPKYWVRTTSKTSEIPTELIQMVVNDVMSDPDVQASLAQEIDLNTYNLAQTDSEGIPLALHSINQLIQNGDIKEDEIMPRVDEIGPLKALQELLYKNAVARETQLAVGTYGGKRTVASGRQISYDEMWKEKEKTKLKNINSQFNTDDISYSEVVHVKPLSLDYDDAVEKRGDYVKNLRNYLKQIQWTENVHPDDIKYDNLGNELPTKGEGLDVDNLSDIQVIGLVQKHLNAYKTAYQNANAPILEYLDWKPGNAPERLDGESDQKYSDRIYSEYLDYTEEMRFKREVGQTHLNTYADVNSLDINKYHDVLNGMASDMQLYDVTNQKINIKLPELSVGDHTNLSYNEYVELRGEQINNTDFMAVGGDDWFLGGGLQLFTAANPWFHSNQEFSLTGQDIVDMYNEWNPDTPITSLLDLKGMNIGSPTAVSPVGSMDNFYLTNLVTGALLRKVDPNKKLDAQTVMNAQMWNNQMADAAGDFVKAIDEMLENEKTTAENAFAGRFDDSPVSMETMIMTNFGSTYETSGQVNAALKNFFKDGVVPSQLMLQSANGKTDAGFSAKSIQEHNIGEYEVVTSQIGITNMEVGGEAQLYIPVKITSGEDEGNVIAFLADASQISIPALNEYLGSAEFEVNKKWISGIQQRLDQYSPSEYSNVTFDYENNTVIIDGEVHDKSKGLAILTENILRYRRYLKN